jgi:hypothetical protein
VFGNYEEQYRGRFEESDQSQHGFRMEETTQSKLKTMQPKKTCSSRGYCPASHPRLSLAVASKAAAATVMI